jgi:hypothetical protein
MLQYSKKGFFMKKKGLVFLLAAIMVVGFFGCGDSGGPGTSITAGDIGKIAGTWVGNMDIYDVTVVITGNTYTLSKYIF